MTCTDARTKNTRTLAKRKNRLITATLAIATSLAFSVASHTVIAGPAHSFTEYVPVLRVEPVYRNVTIREPQRICRPAPHNNHYRPRHDDYRSTHGGRSDHSHRRNRSGDIFVAGVIGGAIGRELSRSVNGRPDTGATIAGAVIGSALASNVINNNRHRGSSDHSRKKQLKQQYFAPVGDNRDRRGHYNARHRDAGHHRNRHRNQHCSTTIQTRTERQRDGFNVTYRYHGQRYQTHTRHHPGDRLAITVTIDPQKY